MRVRLQPRYLVDASVRLELGHEGLTPQVDLAAEPARRTLPSHPRDHKLLIRPLGLAQAADEV